MQSIVSVIFGLIILGSTMTGCSGGTSPAADGPAPVSEELVVPDFSELDPPSNQQETVDEAKEADAAINEQKDKLEAMTVAECRRQDHFEYLGIEEYYSDSRLEHHRVNSDGSFFDYDCLTHYWGWYFEAEEGREVHEWTLFEPEAGSYEFNEDGQAFLPLGHNVPTDMRHPAFDDALTLDEVKPGDAICIHGFSATVDEFVIYGYNYSPEGLVFFPEVLVSDAFSSSDVQHPGQSKWSLEDAGLVPYNNGLWSSSRVTAGPCGSVAV